MSHPQVSVLLPVHNAERYVDEAIRSILGQEGVTLELIAIDDASTDGSLQILRRWADQDARVRLLHLDQNRGASLALHAGLAVAKGTYIARQDADDVSMPNRLAAQTAFLDRAPETVLVGTNYVHIDANGRVIFWAQHDESPSVLSFLLNFTNSLGVPGQGMFRADVAREVGGFSREIRFAQGYELWTRLATRGRVAVLPIIGIRYRVHDRSTTALHSEEQRETAVAVCRRTLSHTVGRKVSREDAEAAYRLWHGDAPVGSAGRAHAVISAAWEAYLRTNPPVDDQARAREAVARRFARAAFSSMKRHKLAEARVCVRSASSWHSMGLLGVGIAVVAARARTALMTHRARSAQ